MIQPLRQPILHLHRFFFQQWWNLMQNVHSVVSMEYPVFQLLFGQYHRHTIMDIPDGFIGLGGQNNIPPFTFELVIKTRQPGYTAFWAAKQVFLLARVLLPLVKAGGRNHAPPFQQTFSKQFLLLRRFCPRIDDDAFVSEVGKSPNQRLRLQPGIAADQYWGRIGRKNLRCV